MVVIGVIAVFTAPVVLAVDGATVGFVINVEVATEGPVPAEFVAVTAAVY